MYFILRINTLKHTSRIIGYAMTLEDAIEAVREKAHEYVVAKNEHVLTRSDADDKMKITDRVMYFQRESHDVVHAMDVFQQHTVKDKGWFRDGYKENASHMKRFMYYRYDDVTLLEEEEEDDSESDEEFQRVSRAQELGLSCANTVGGFPSNVLDDLRNTIRSKKTEDLPPKNPPPFKHTFFVSSEEE